LRHEEHDQHREFAMSERNKNLTEMVEERFGLKGIDPQAEYNVRKTREARWREDTQWSPAEMHRMRPKANEEGIQDAKVWRRHWETRAAEEAMQDEGDLLVRPVISWRTFVKAGIVALIVYALLTAAAVLLP